jgi:hypothetical protein
VSVEVASSVIAPATNGNVPPHSDPVCPDTLPPLTMSSQPPDPIAHEPSVSNLIPRELPP